MKEVMPKWMKCGLALNVVGIGKIAHAILYED